MASLLGLTAAFTPNLFQSRCSVSRPEQQIVPSFVTLSMSSQEQTDAFDKEEIPDSVSEFSTNKNSSESKDSTAAATTPTTNDSTEQLFFYIQSLGAITNRGQFASKVQHASAKNTIEKLETMNPHTKTAWSPLIQGRWELVYSSTQLFRSSPFFMAGRAVCYTKQQAAQYNWFCDMHRKALAISEIKAVRQIVSQDRLVSEFEVQAGAVPFLSDFAPFRYSGGLPVTIEGAIVSSADLKTTVDGTGWQLLMDTVEIKGSNLPVLRQVLDSGMKLPTRSLGNFLESTVPQYANPEPIFSTTYLDERFRISRDQDDNVFVYVKTSSATQVTDYSNIDSDLGLIKLLEGFNDAVTQFYL